MSVLSEAAGADIANRRAQRCLAPASQNSQGGANSRDVSVDHVQALTFSRRDIHAPVDCRTNPAVKFLENAGFGVDWPLRCQRKDGLFVRRLMAAPVQVFGRRDADTIHALFRPASKKRQGTKSRDVCRVGAAGAMGILPQVRAC